MHQRRRGWIMPEADMLSMQRLIEERICSPEMSGARARHAAHATGRIVAGRTTPCGVEPGAVRYASRVSSGARTSLLRA